MVGQPESGQCSAKLCLPRRLGILRRELACCSGNPLRSHTRGGAAIDGGIPALGPASFRSAEGACGLRAFDASADRRKENCVDAIMLARVNDVLDLVPPAPRHQNFHDRQRWLTARRALIKGETSGQRCRSAASVALITGQGAQLRVDDDLGRIGLDWAGLADMAARLAERLAILRQHAPSRRCHRHAKVGKLPEKQEASPTGPSPLTLWSDKWHGK